MGLEACGDRASRRHSAGSIRFEGPRRYRRVSVAPPIPPGSLCGSRGPDVRRNRRPARVFTARGRAASSGLVGRDRSGPGPIGSSRRLDTCKPHGESELVGAECSVRAQRPAAIGGIADPPSQTTRRAVQAAAEKLATAAASSSYVSNTETSLVIVSRSCRRFVTRISFKVPPDFCVVAYA